MTICQDMGTELAEVEVRCPVSQWRGGQCKPGRLLTKLYLSGGTPSFVHPDNLIELACPDCKYRARKAGLPVIQVLHRFDLAGNLVGTLTAEE